jgi:hypothetical protein
MQGDSNLVLYFGARPLWESGTGGGSDGSRLVMQEDGNLVIYGMNGAPIWAADSNRSGVSELFVQNDSNVVIYNGGAGVWDTKIRHNSLLQDERLTAGQTLWSLNGKYRLVMQRDSNLVIYDPSGAIYESGTGGGPDGSQLVMQGDGNLVMYRSDGTPYWDTKTNGTGRYELIMQNDGNLVVYADGAARWASRGVPPPRTPRDIAANAALATVGHVWAQDTGDAGYFSTNDWSPGPYGEWSGDCVKLTVAAYRHANMTIPTSGTARQMFYDYQARGLIRQGAPPAGALVFYPNQAPPYGHIAVAVNGNEVATTMGLDGDQAANARKPISYFGEPAGWALPPGA